jgi:hypothetical protein
MLVNFFKNIFPFKSKLHYENNEPSYLLYKELSTKPEKLEYTLSLYKENQINDQLLDGCLKHAINYNHIHLIEKLYPYMKKHHKGLKKDHKDSLLFNYAKVAMEANKIEIFDYFIKIYHEKLPAYSYTPMYSPKEFSHLIDSMIEHKQVYYFNILENYELFNCQNYLESIIKGNIPIIKNSNEINKIIDFMLDNFPLESHDLSKDFNDKSIDINELLLAACNSPYWEKDVIINLVDRGADVNYKSYSPLSYIIKKENLDMVQFLLGKGAKFLLLYTDSKNKLYPWLEQWKKSEFLVDELSNEMGNNNAPIKTTRVKL